MRYLLCPAVGCGHNEPVTEGDRGAAVSELRAHVRDRHTNGSQEKTEILMARSQERESQEREE
ncbi:hypothetical protein [Streptomyces sp. 8L]|uniref:hypothetical protein n=1 Tax=unclassified Streptomyces TaxID=2593676 RepID=UPI001CD4E37B|nr:hypothetical protein [Streptomyces sp. 8L]MCA1217498.1 hypothetical protein [Streptomyces sp. 8L]